MRRRTTALTIYVNCRESVKYPPAAGRKKVYIIDEVHMLSTGAFNALLKTLEEPPEYVVFILATTEPPEASGYDTFTDV